MRRQRTLNCAGKAHSSCFQVRFSQDLIATIPSGFAFDSLRPGFSISGSVRLVKNEEKYLAFEKYMLLRPWLHDPVGVTVLEGLSCLQWPYRMLSDP